MAEGEQDEQKKMKLQLEKMDAMLKIPYNEEDDDSTLQPTARARNKARVRGISLRGGGGSGGRGGGNRRRGVEGGRRGGGDGVFGGRRGA